MGRVYQVIYCPRTRQVESEVAASGLLPVSPADINDQNRAEAAAGAVTPWNAQSLVVKSFDFARVTAKARKRWNRDGSSDVNRLEPTSLHSSLSDTDSLTHSLSLCNSIEITVISDNRRLSSIQTAFTRHMRPLLGIAQCWMKARGGAEADEGRGKLLLRHQGKPRSAKDLLAIDVATTGIATI